MKLEEIKTMAKTLGVAPGKMKKAELIRAIQLAEENPCCFETAQAESCGQSACLWRRDCR